MIQLRSICLSAHLDSFCQRLSELAELEFVYKTDDPGEMRRSVGWNLEPRYECSPMTKESLRRAEDCDFLIDMMREMDLMERRVFQGKKTAYASERWLKPLTLKGIRLPAIFRIFSPSYFMMVKRFVRLMDNECFWVLPCGVHAARDFVRLYGLMHGDLRCLFRIPHIKVVRHLVAPVEGFSRMRLWGYFVADSCKPIVARPPLVNRTMKILWCGRMLDWKRVDVLVRAFKKIQDKRPVALLLVGEGPERDRLLRMAGTMAMEKLGWDSGMICFNGYVASTKVRELMRESDVYVMPSNAEEGWGAAVSDAMSEGCPVISTYEAGSSATLLPENRLYHANDVDGLAQLLLDFKGESVESPASEWSGATAAEKLLEVVR